VGHSTYITKYADQQEVDFIRKWIFPGGFLPTVSYVMESIQKGADNKLVVDSIANIGVSLYQEMEICADRPSHTTLGHSGNGEDGSSLLSNLERCQL
jgi:cyclopropane fatty-acyl-phospholipid synthase-like methyltransferase